MARISNYFHLCPINDEEELFGLAPDHSKGTVINTLGKNIVIIVKVIEIISRYLSVCIRLLTGNFLFTESA